VKPFRSGCVWLALMLNVAFVLPGPLLAQTAEPSSEISPPAPELKTVAVVAVAHYEKLLNDVSFLGTMLGRPDASQMIEGGFSLFTQGKGPEALDKSKPWGVIVQTDGSAFLPIGCLPVSKPNNVIEIATGFGATVTDTADGVKQLVLPNQKTFFLKQQNGWAFISLSPAALSKLPAAPQDVLADLVTEYDIAARVSMKDVPEMYRQFAVAAMQAGLHQKLQKQAGESDEQYALRQKVTDAQMVQVQRALNETDAITVGWAIDTAQQRTFLDYTQTFLPDTKMIQQIAAYGQPQTNFAGFFQPQSAATIAFVSKANPETIRQDLDYLESSMQTLRAGFNNGIDSSKAPDSEAIKAAFSDWFDALEATIRAGRIDGGASVLASSDSLTVIAGAVVTDTAKFESGLKKLEAAAAGRPEFTGIKWNAAEHAGVKFHTLTIPIPEQQEAPRKLLGSEANIAIGIGTETVYLALGRDNLEQLKKAIDSSAAEPNKAVPPFELAVSVGPVMEVAAAQAEEGKQKEIAQSVADMLGNESQGRDHVRVVGQMLPNGMRYRVEIEEGALRAVGTALNEAQRQSMQANQ
jgi:hypothetical protein